MERADEIRELAALYSLGVLEGDDARRFQQFLAEDERAAVWLASFEQAASALTFLAPPQTPPPSLKDKVLQRIRRPVIPPGSAALVRACDGDWLPAPFAGVEVRCCFPIPRMATTQSWSEWREGPNILGTVTPRSSTATCWKVILVFHDHTLYAGDFEVACSGTAHSSVTTRNGCLLLVTNNERDELLA